MDPIWRTNYGKFLRFSSKLVIKMRGHEFYLVKNRYEGGFGDMHKKFLVNFRKIKYGKYNNLY